MGIEDSCIFEGTSQRELKRFFFGSWKTLGYILDGPRVTEKRIVRDILNHYEGLYDAGENYQSGPSDDFKDTILRWLPIVEFKAKAYILRYCADGMPKTKETFLRQVTASEIGPQRASTIKKLDDVGLICAGDYFL